MHAVVPVRTGKTAKMEKMEKMGKTVNAAQKVKPGPRVLPV